MFGAALAICCLLSELRASTIASAVILAFFFAYIVFFRATLFFKYLAFLFAMISNIAGCLATELLSAWLPELRCYSYYAGSAPLLIMGWWVFLTTLYAYDSYKGAKVEEDGFAYRVRPSKALDWSNILVFALCCVLFLHVVAHPSFMEGLDRFDYNRIYITGLWSIADSWIGFLIVASLLQIRAKQSRLAIASVALYCVYLFWTGTKFGDFFTVVCLLCLVFYDKIAGIDPNRCRKAVFGTCAACLVLVAVAGFAYSFTSDKEIGEFYSDRLAQQGQLWWRMYDTNDGSLHADEFDAEIEALTDDSSISQSVGAMHGIYLAMYLSAPSSVVDNKLSGGSRYSMAGFACAYYYFGLAGVAIFAIGMGCLAGALSNAIVRAFCRGELIAGVILVRFLSLARASLAMFLFSSWFTSTSVVCMCFLLLRYLMDMHEKRCKLSKSAKLNQTFDSTSDSSLSLFHSDYEYDDAS